MKYSKLSKVKNLKNKNMEKKTFVEWIIYLKNKKNINTDGYFYNRHIITGAQLKRLLNGVFDIQYIDQ